MAYKSGLSASRSWYESIDNRFKWAVGGGAWYWENKDLVATGRSGQVGLASAHPAIYFSRQGTFTKMNISK